MHRFRVVIDKLLEYFLSEPGIKGFSFDLMDGGGMLSIVARRNGAIGEELSSRRVVSLIEVKQHVNAQILAEFLVDVFKVDLMGEKLRC